MTNEEKIHIPIDVENFRDNKKLYASFIKDHKNCCDNYYQEEKYTTYFFHLEGNWVSLYRMGREINYKLWEMSIK